MRHVKDSKFVCPSCKADVFWDGRMLRCRNDHLFDPAIVPDQKDYDASDEKPEMITGEIIEFL